MGSPTAGPARVGSAPVPALRAHLALAAGPGAEGWLVLLVEEGAVELERVLRLRGSAARAFEVLCAGGGPAELAAELRRAGAAGAEAERDARDFLADLVRRGLAQEAGAEPGPRHPVDVGDAGEHGRVPGGASDAADRAAWEAPAVLGAAELVGLAREALARGLRLRFRANGRSMRPWIPHGARVEIEPARFDAVRAGEVVLYATPSHPLVAHRVLRRDPLGLVACGDSAGRIDVVAEGAFLGRVARSAAPGGRWRPVSSGWRRPAGLASGHLRRGAARLAAALVLRPLARTLGRPSRRRAALRALLRLSSGGLTRVARACERLRAPLDVARAALLSTAEKDAERRGLYARRSVQEFTSLDENVAAGLTLLEEALLARHAIAPGRALVLGCGPGRESLALAARGFEVTGLDREEGLLSRASEAARRRGLSLRLVLGEATDFRLGERFDHVVVFSGLLDMVLPRARRVALLARAREHLAPGGRVLVTFLSAYVPPAAGGPAPPAPNAGPWSALNPEHEPGDTYLLNETVHVYPRGADLAGEARAAGLEVEALHRDQRAYDRAAGRVRGYAVLRVAGEA